MPFEPIRRDTPTNTLIAAMEHADGATDAIVLLVKDKSETHETIAMFASDNMTLATMAWILEGMKLRLHKVAGEDE